MQDGWSDEGLNTSRHSSWEEEDSGSGMWGNRPQESSSSISSGGWNQGQGGRRTGAKVCRVLGKPLTLHSVYGL